MPHYNAQEHSTMLRQIGEIRTAVDERLTAAEDNLETLASRVQREAQRNSPMAREMLGGGGAGAPGVVTLGFDRDGEPVRGYRKSARLAPGGDDGEELGRIVRGLLLGERTDRAASGAVASSGGVLLEKSVAGQILDIARARSAVLEAGGITVPMGTRELTVAKIAALPTAAWRPENVAVTPGSPTFEGITLRARTVAIILNASLELFEDAANLGAALRTSLGEALGVEFDRVSLVGTGSASEPLGIANTSGVGTQTSVGSPTYDDFVDAVTAVRNANGEPTAAILNPRDAATLSKLKGATEGHYIVPPAALQALPMLQTTNVPKNLGGGANESLAFVGDFSHLWIGMRTDSIRLDVSKDAAHGTDSAFTSLQVWLRAWARVDVAVVRPDHFVTLSGITA